MADTGECARPPPMSQTWEEQGENEVAYLELVKRQKAGAYTPYREVIRWRRRFWSAFAIAVIEGLVLFYAGWSNK